MIKTNKENLEPRPSRPPGTYFFYESQCVWADVEKGIVQWVEDNEEHCKRLAAMGYKIKKVVVK